jgi:multimeric flavodoxin WrbA
MKKLTAFVGSARQGHTHRAVRELLDNLRALEEVECEIVSLADYRIETCRGCMLCLDKGEHLCPLRDDRDLLIARLDASDGVIFATPNYSFQVSGLMKTFLDRLGFLFHRPRFFGKAFTAIVAQGVYGGDKILSYLDFVGSGLGFSTVKGSCLLTREPVTDKAQRRNDRSLADLSRRFHRLLKRPAPPAPNLFKLMIFRWTRAFMKQMLDSGFRDPVYYREQGWLDSDYFHPVRLGVFKKAAGRLFDALAARSARKG